MDSLAVKRSLELLDPVRFVQLCADLISEISASAGNSRSCIKANLAVFEPDGGIDATCDAALALVPRVLPRPKVGYQFKSGTKRSAQAVARHDIAKKPRVVERLRDGGVFVLATSWNLADGFEDSVREHVRGEGLAIDDEQIVCIGSFELAQLIIDFPSLAFSVLGAGDATLLTVFDWAALPTHRIEFESDDRITDAIADVRKRLELPRSIVRVVGAAGNGKSRLVLEAVAGSSFAATVLYAPQVADVTAQFANFLRRRPGVRCTLIVDEVSVADAERLSMTFGAMPDGVRLLMIGVDASGRGTTTAVPVPGMQRETMVRLIRGAAPGLDESAAHSLASICGGSPKLGVLLARRVNDDPSLAARHRLLADGDVRRGLELYLTADINDLAWRAVAGIGMVGHVGWIDEADAESEQLFRALSLDPTDARRGVELLDERFGIAPLAGRFRYVSPALLGDHLAARELDTWSQHRAATVLSALGEYMSKRFAGRLRSIAGVIKNRAAFEAAIFGFDGAFTNFAALIESPSAVVLLHRLSPVFPDTVLRILERLLESATTQHLREATSPRRSLLYAVEALLWRSDTFERAARLLLRLALAENETYGNNATGIWAETFQTHLGRTAAGPNERFKVLAETVGAIDPESRVLAAAALERVIRTDHISRFGRPDTDVDGMPDEAWQPSTHGEWWEVARRAIALLGKLAADPADEVRIAAAKALARSADSATYLPVSEQWAAAVASLRGGPYEARAAIVDATRTEVRRRSAHGVPTSEAEDALELEPIEPNADDPDNERSVASDAESSQEDASKAEIERRVLVVARAAADLLGTDFASRLRRELGRDPWVTSRLGLDEAEARLRRRLLDLTVDAIANPALVEQEWAWIADHPSTFSFIWCDVLGSADSQRATAPGLVRAALRDPRAQLFLSGYEIAFGRAADDPGWVDRRVAELRADGHVVVALDLLYRAGHAPQRVAVVADLLVSAGVPPTAIAVFAYPPWGSLLTTPDAMVLAAAVQSRHSHAASAALVTFLHYYVRSHPESLESFEEIALRALSDTANELDRYGNDSFSWGVLARAYALRAPIQIARVALEVASRSGPGLDREVRGVLDAVWKVAEKRRLFNEVFAPWIDAGGLPGWRVRDALERFPLADIGLDHLREWIAAKPDDRATEIARIAGPPHHPVSDLHAMLLSSFDRRVGNTLFGELISGVFMSQASGRTKGLLDGVKPMLDDPRPAVRGWAVDTVRGLEGMLRDDLRREAEEEIGRAL